jgi:magnesium transporter
MIFVIKLLMLSVIRWFGFALMNVGEIGNFLSYGFAPASVVAPLGAVSTT